MWSQHNTSNADIIIEATVESFHHLHKIHLDYIELAPLNFHLSLLTSFIELSWIHHFTLQVLEYFGFKFEDISHLS
jgi:hypothetical protein